jgi:hypothetical protein
MEARPSVSETTSGVAKLVNTPMAQTGRSADPWHGLPEGLGIERRADGRGEHNALCVSPDPRRLSLSGLEGLMRLESYHDGLRKLRGGRRHGGEQAGVECAPLARAR